MVEGVSKFVGRSRKLLVDGLVDIFCKRVRAGESLWVSLEAPSGWGKTRVGKQFYSRLAATQKPPFYWPATLGEVSRGDRKVVTPKGKRKNDSLPDFLWWGMSCSSDDRFRAAVLREGLGELESHSQYVSIACSRNRPIGERAINKLRSEAWEFAKGGAMEGLGVATKALEVTLPGMGLAVLAGRRIANAVRDQVSDSRLVAEESELGASSRGLVEELVEPLGEFGDAKFPVVLFVEDLHFADEALIDALDAMMRRVSHLLVVTTAWPGRINESARLSRLARELGERAVRVDDLQPAGAPFPDGASLMELERDACKAIVLEHYKHANPETVALLVDRYRNPCALDLVCSMEGYKEEYGELGDLYIAPDEIADLPAATEELYRAYWDQLPKEVRLRYAVAAAISPAAINSDEGAGYHIWSAPVLGDVIKSLNLQTTAGLHSDINATTDVYGWVMHVDEYLRRWSEIDQHQIAADAGGTLLKKQLKSRKKVLTAVADAVLSDDSPSAHAARTIIALRAEKFITDDSVVARAIAVALCDLGYDDTAIRERIRLYEHYMNVVTHANVDEHTDLEVRFNGIDALAASRRYTRAIEEYRVLHKHSSEVRGDDDRLTVRSLYYLAVNLENAGRNYEAVKAFKHAHAESTRVLGDAAADTLDVRTGLAGALESAGQTNEAIEILRQVLADHVETLGDRDTATLASRRRLAEALESAGQANEAIEIFRQVLADRVETLGDDHPDTLSARLALAQTLTGTGNMEAISMFKQVAADRARVLGEDHPDTWEARICLAEALNDTGQWDQATAVFEQVVDDRTRMLGEDHPDTLEARYQLAYNSFGVETEGIFEQLLTDRSNVLGEDHPDTLTTRYQLGVELLGTDPDRAREMFEHVLHSRAKVLGKDHPDTLDAHSRMAQALGLLGDINGAIEQYEKVVAESAKVLGEDHFEAWNVRSLLAELLRRDGQVEAALAMHKQVLDHHIETFGPCHPKTLDMHLHLGMELLMLGQIQEGIDIYKQVIEKMVEMWSDDHPEVWLARSVLANELREVGRFDEALDIFKQVRDDRIRVLGENHEDTLNARRDVGLALLDAGRADRAIPILEEALAGCIKALGNDNYLTRRARDELREGRNAASRIDEA